VERGKKFLHRLLAKVRETSEFEETEFAKTAAVYDPVTVYF